MENYRVLPVHKYETYAWFLRKHYLQRLPNITASFGLYHFTELVGVISFGIPASPFLCRGICGEKHASKVIELNRLCLSQNKKNEASFLIGGSLRLLERPKIVVSFADTSMGHLGKIYQATNFYYTGLTKERTDVDTGHRHSRHIDGLDKSKRKMRYSKHRYVKFLGTKTERRTLLKDLRYPLAPYPTGTSNRYNADEKVPTQYMLDV